ncbi:MAG: glycosyltransferase [Candidatus Bathyarchaeia archaeon]
MSPEIKVLVPLKRENTPYLKLLYTHVEKCGVKVLHSRSLWSVDFLKKCLLVQIIHFHWIEYLIRHRNILLSLTKFLLATLLLLLFKLGRKRIVITVHNIRPHETLYPKLEALWFKIILFSADKIIVHNKYSYMLLREIYGKSLTNKVQIIPHGAFIGYYPNEISQDEARKMLYIPNNAFVILFFGAIRDYKGIDDLLVVSKDLLSEQKNLFLIICGKVQSERLHKMLLNFHRNFREKCIIKPQYIPDNEVQIYMNAADIGILPYKEITTSGAVLLFQSFAKTVIIPDLPPIKETLGEYGIYFRRGDKEDMKKSIIKALLLGREQLRALGRRAFEKSLELDWNNIAYLTSKLYYSLTNP